jgi:hypothetical protein
MSNYVMGLCSSPHLHHPVEITKSLFCNYTYSNLTKVLNFWKLSDDEFLKFIKNYLPAEQKLSNGKPYRMMSHDLTKLSKPHSNCLPNRGYVIESNPVAQNLSLTAGYYVSVLHVNDLEGDYAPPLLMKRLEVETDKNAEILAQIKFVMEHSDMPFKDMISLFNGDSAYGKAAIIAPMYEYENLIGILRMRSGMKIWTSYEGVQQGGGAPRIYGEKYYLRDTDKEITDIKSGKESIQLGINSLLEDEKDSYEMTMKNGREVVVEIKRWKNMLLRSKAEANMKDKPFDILHVTIRDKKTEELVFDRPMYLAITGKKKQEVTSLEAQRSYRKRFDAEKVYRFGNQNLLMNKLQSPVIEHQDTWLKIVQIAYWLLYVARNEITKIDFEVWQKYLPMNKNIGESVVGQIKLSLSQVQKSVHRLFCTFDKTLFLPQKCKKGKGRILGTKLVPRKSYPIVKKIRKVKPIPTYSD